MLAFAAAVEQGQKMPVPQMLEELAIQFAPVSRIMKESIEVCKIIPQERVSESVVAQAQNSPAPQIRKIFQRL